MLPLMDTPAAGSDAPNRMALAPRDPAAEGAAGGVAAPPRMPLAPRIWTALGAGVMVLGLAMFAYGWMAAAALPDAVAMRWWSEGLETQAATSHTRGARVILGIAPEPAKRTMPGWMLGAWAVGLVSAGAVATAFGLSARPRVRAGR